MYESEDGTVTGSIDRSRLDQIQPKTDEAKAQIDALKAQAQEGDHAAQLAAERAAEQAEAQQVQPAGDQDEVTTAQAVPVGDQTGTQIASGGDQPQGDVQVRDEPEGDLDALRAEAESRGVKVDKRWGADRLRQEIDTARQG